jgi:hypothetical protein
MPNIELEIAGDSASLSANDRVVAVRHRAVPAWVMSFALHTAILVSVAVLYRSTERGADVESTRVGGIVLVTADTETTEYLSEGDSSDTSAPSETAAQSPPPLPDQSQRPVELPGIAASTAEVSGIGDDLLEALPGVNTPTDGTFKGRDIGGKVTTEVFGVKGTGSRFIYVFDRSDSMDGYESRPLRAAKQALLTSLDSLGDVHEFQIVFYNEGTRVFSRGGNATMYFATQDNRTAARRFIETMTGEGGTDHLQALKFALSLAPDVVFLLTDAEGGFTPAELGAIAGWNRSGAVINAIEFGVGAKNDSDPSLERLASQNRGQHLYKNILTLEK